MSVNILEMVQGAMGDSVVNQIGGLLGENEASTGKAVSTALPSILGGLMKQSASPSGAQAVFDMAKGADSGILGNLSGALGGGSHNSLIQNGMGMIGSIFGGQQSGLIGTIARMAGIGQGSAGSLLGMLAPILMGAISKVSSSQNLDAGGLANMLASQKDHVASALPPEMKDQLGLGSLFAQGSAAVSGAAASVTGAAASMGDAARDGVTAAGNTVRDGVGAAGDAVRDGVGAAGDAVRGGAAAAGGAAQDAGRAVTETARSGGGMLSKLLPIIILALLGWLGWKFLAGNTDEMKDAATQGTEAVTNAATEGAAAVTDAAKSAMPDVDLDGMKEKLTSTLGDATTAVSGITDAASAEGAVEKLKGAAGTLDGMNLDSLPGPAKTAIGGVIGPLMGTLQGAIEKAYAIPGVQSVLEPVAGPMLEKLSALAG